MGDLLGTFSRKAVLYRAEGGGRLFPVEMHTCPVPIAKSREIWVTMPAARNFIEDEANVPVFGRKWCTCFLKRWSITEHTFHGESNEAQRHAAKPEVQEHMEELRQLASHYDAEDIYNVDQTGLYWRRLASSGLSSTVRGGAKLDKRRISAGLCCNATGTDRFQLWLVGKAKQPHALNKFNRSAYNSEWRFNKKAWFTSDIMKDWFRAFYAHIAKNQPRRSILLLMENFSAHQCGLDAVTPPAHITVRFLPANVTSIYQPLDQGIINNTKQFIAGFCSSVYAWSVMRILILWRRWISALPSYGSFTVGFLKCGIAPYENAGRSPL